MNVLAAELAAGSAVLAGYRAPELVLFQVLYATHLAFAPDLSGLVLDPGVVGPSARQLHRLTGAEPGSLAEGAFGGAADALVPVGDSSAAASAKATSVGFKACSSLSATTSTPGRNPAVVDVDIGSISFTTMSSTLECA